MVLPKTPTPGNLSLGAIQTEFGGSNPASMSEYVTHVGKTAAAGQNVSFSLFSELSSNPNGVLNLSAVTGTFNASGYNFEPTQAYNFNNDRTHEELDNNNTTVLSPAWLVNGNVADYDVRFTVSSGDSFLHGSSAARGTWHPCENAGNFLLTFGSSTAGVSQSTVFTVDIRDGTTLAILATSPSCTLNTYRIH